MRKVLTVLLALSFIFTASTAFADKWDDLLVESARVFEEMTEMPEEGIPASAIKNAYAIAIFPSVIGGGFVFGGKYGQGIVIAKMPKTATGELLPFLILPAQALGGK